MKSLFDAERTSLDDALALTEASLCAYGESYSHWILAYSGGKDSTATLSTVIWLIESGRIRRPKSLSIFYADTRMELPPLHANAMRTIQILKERNYNAVRALPDAEHRFFVYMFGRGVPPPSNTFRWCTEQLKIRPIDAEIAKLASIVGEKPLLLLGLRLGESAARDRRILLSCGRNGGECGQGWFQERPPRECADTLAPILHWRTCHVWDWLIGRKGKYEYGLPTRMVAEVYDQDEEGSATEINARTGCVGCNLASQDFSLQRLLRNPRFAYLAPLRSLKSLYASLKLPQMRLRKDGWERRADGQLVKNPNRLGPLTMEARRFGLNAVLKIQEEVNNNRPCGEDEYLLIDEEERSLIEKLIEDETWPNGWEGDEPRGDELIPEVYRDGTQQNWLFDRSLSFRND